MHTNIRFPPFSCDNYLISSVSSKSQVCLFFNLIIPETTACFVTSCETWVVSVDTGIK